MKKIINLITYKELANQIWYVLYLYLNFYLIKYLIFKDILLSKFILFNADELTQVYKKDIKAALDIYHQTILNFLFQKKIVYTNLGTYQLYLNTRLYEGKYKTKKHYYYIPKMRPSTGLNKFIKSYFKGE